MKRIFIFNYLIVVMQGYHQRVGLSSIVYSYPHPVIFLSKRVHAVQNILAKQPEPKKTGLLLHLNGTRRLAGDIINHTANAIDLVYNPPAHPLKELAIKGIPVCRHEV